MRPCGREAIAWVGALAWAEGLALAAQQTPIVVDVVEQPTPAEDISISVVLGIFAIAGIFLLAAAIGSALVAGGILLYKRWRERTTPASEPTHTRLRI
jgi:hypothetical protein